MNKHLNFLMCAICVGVLVFTSFSVKELQAETTALNTPDYYILAEDNETVRFASQELKDYILKITGYTTPIYNIGNDFTITGTPIYLGVAKTLNETFDFNISTDDLKWDGYKLVPVNGGMAITSNEERGVIYGVYEALEMVGCEWYGAYEGGEYVPQSKQINLIVNQSKTVNPDSWYRIYHNEGWYENGVSQINDERLYAYALKMRCNDYGRGYSQTIWSARTKYDLINLAGGHNVADEYLTDAVFKTNPEMFVERNGERVKIAHSTNWCCNPENGALDFLAEKIGNTLRADSTIKLYQIYGVDTGGDFTARGGWCNCAWCMQYNSADLILMSIIHVANALQEEFPDVHFGSIYYHDTLDVSKVTYTKEDIPDNVCAIWAAREACPKHSILDATCAKNVFHKKNYDAIYNLYGDDKIYGFLYYGDGVLYNKGVFYKAEQAIEEIRYYTSHGMNAFLELSTNEVGGFMYGITESVVLRLLWDNDYDAESYLERHKKWFFGTDSETANQITDLLYTITGELNKYCGYTADCDIRYVLIKDATSRAFAEQHYKDIRATLPLYAKLDAIFTKILNENDDIGVRERIGKMRCHLQMTKLVAEYTAWEVEGLCYKFDGDGETLANCMDEAIILVHSVEHLYNSWPTSMKDGNTYWYVTALGKEQANVFEWLKY